MRKSLQKVTLMCLFALFAIVAKAQNDVTAHPINSGERNPLDSIFGSLT